MIAEDIVKLNIFTIYKMDSDFIPSPCDLEALRKELAEKNKIIDELILENLSLKSSNQCDSIEELDVDVGENSETIELKRFDDENEDDDDLDILPNLGENMNQNDFLNILKMLMSQGTQGTYGSPNPSLNLEKGEEEEGDQLEQGEADQLEQGEGDQLEQGEGDQLEQGEGDQLEQGEADQLEQGEADQLEQGEGDQLEQGEGDQLEQGEADQLEQGEGDQLEQGEGDQLEQGEADQLEQGEGEQDIIDDLQVD
jgi:hypothetical protein